jgi:outer membrane protein assembly factor BamB
MRVLLVLLLLPSTALAQSWNQWGGGPRHDGSLPVYAQPLRERLADVVYDPFVDSEMAEAGGSLLVHYQTPLSDGNDLFMAVKGGTYTGFISWDTQTWSVRKFEWQRGVLVELWTATSDWDPVPPGASRFEPVFHAVLAHGFLYMPGAGGTVLEIDRASGARVRRLGEFGSGIDSTTFVISPISADDAGNLYYNTLNLPDQNPWSEDHNGSWLVKITPEGVASRVSYSELVPDAPAPNAQCLADFTSDQLPWPPSPTAVPRSIPCGSQRSALNLAPAIGADGTVYTVSRAHLNNRWSYLIAVNPNLTLKWTASLRNRLSDGCNVLLPFNGQPGGCRGGAATGVDPSDNQPGSGVVNDNSTSTPIVAPDGSIFYGAYTRYNHSQGHLVHFSASGQYLGAYPFGWDVTPAIWSHDGTYSIITKENRYAGVGSYCNNSQFCPSNARVPGDEQGYFITQLSAALDVEWRYRGTNTSSCHRNADGSIDCIDDQPSGFEWCVNAPAVDARGVVYVNSEDGFLYAIDQGGTLRERLFLQLALGAAYTPLSFGSDGRIYTQNAGHLFAVGSTGKRRAVR